MLGPIFQSPLGTTRVVYKKKLPLLLPQGSVCQNDLICAVINYAE